MQPYLPKELHCHCFGMKSCKKQTNFLTSMSVLAVAVAVAEFEVVKHKNDCLGKFWVSQFWRIFRYKLNKHFQE